MVHIVSAFNVVSERIIGRNANRVTAALVRSRDRRVIHNADLSAYPVLETNAAAIVENPAIAIPTSATTLRVFWGSIVTPNAAINGGFVVG